jgi:type VI secretion system protein ImpJ
MDSRPLARVVWEEGMHLAQHHFQAQSRFFETSSAFALSSLFFRSYGFVALELDGEALLNGTVTLTHARGFLPDGLPFHFPHDPAPEPLAIRELFSPTEPSHLVHLAIPAYRQGGPNTAPASDAPDLARYRFVPDAEERTDEVTGDDSRPITVARKNFRLVLDPQLEEDGLVSLPVARVERDGAGNFVFDATFVPPVLRVGAVDALTSLLDRATEMLEVRAGGLAAAGGTPEVGEMWLAHAVHQSLPVLRHMRETRGAHPEVVYAELARLAGALCTFSLDARPEDLPLYDHDDLGGCFTELERHLRRGLEVVLPTGSYRVPVAPSGDFVHTASVSNREDLPTGEIYLGVRSSGPTGDLAGTVARLVKVCSGQHIQRLVKEAFPGLPLEHVPSPPAVLRPRAGTAYFRLEKSGPCWASISDTAEVGIYAPAAIPDAELELVVVPAG